jgi:hypothetical protein
MKMSTSKYREDHTPDLLQESLKTSPTDLLKSSKMVWDVNNISKNENSLDLESKEVLNEELQDFGMVRSSFRIPFLSGFN